MGEEIILNKKSKIVRISSLAKDERSKLIDKLLEKYKILKELRSDDKEEDKEYYSIIDRGWYYWVLFKLIKKK